MSLRGERSRALAGEPASTVGIDGAGREPERWRVAGTGAARRLQSWSEILATTHLPFEVRPTCHTPDTFHAAVTRRAIGDLMLVDCATSPFLGHRSAGLIDADAAGDRADEILGFQLVCKGVELVRERGRELALQPGDVVLWDSLQPTDVEIVEPFCKRTLILPRARVLAVCPRLAELSTLPPLKDSGLARLLVRYINALAAELPGLDPDAAAAAANAALELLRATVEPQVPDSRSATRAAARAEIRRYVRTHLQDPLLGPASIARAYTMSVRALHALFEDADTSVAGLVRAERLARCHEDLRRHNGGSVTDIASRWGFGDAAHFSRVFKRAFGVTPSEVRHDALAQASNSGPDRGSGEKPRSDRGSVASPDPDRAL